MKSFIKIVLTVSPFVYMGVIWTLSSLPDTAVIELASSKWDRIFKESLHVIEFAILYVLFVAALLAHNKLSYAVNFIAALAAIFYGFIDEIHQSFIPYRSATLIDAAKDLFGVMVCFLIINRTYFRETSSFGKTMKRVEAWMKG
ncbi:VanZ family protein [Bacillus seohaeanensis]|uniref:VanZ family protein n=1 Tax=Bacillus seohaeanensis TaxID=284580 RepID=A0ABW5RWX7_9BACI